MRIRITLTALLAALVVLGLAATAMAKDKRYRDDVFKKVERHPRHPVRPGSALTQYGEG